MSWYEMTTVNGFAETNFVTTTVTAVGGDVSFSRYPHDAAWSSGTTNPNVVYEATETVYASATDSVSSSDLSIITSAATPSVAATTTSSAAANALSVIGYAGDGMGAGFPSVIALAACFATMGVALFGRRY